VIQALAPNLGAALQSITRGLFDGSGARAGASDGLDEVRCIRARNIRSFLEEMRKTERKYSIARPEEKKITEVCYHKFVIVHLQYG
jgi:hypothetical protein